MSNIDNIRNFAIIAHIDHGKSTIADRIIHSCGGLTEREMKAQVLDSMDIERERGITIKAQTVKLNYKAKDGKNYILNIIDTPGHVDFSYEVSRSLYACEGSILIVDSTQGVEAQTLANVYQALDINHEIVPVLNKVDLPASDLDRTKTQIEEVIGIDTEGAIPCSGKTGEGIEDILEQIIKVLPSPKGESLGDLKCLLVDSWYDTYLGVVILVRVIDGKISKNMKIKMMSTNQEYIIEKVGVFTPKATDINELNAGEIGFITTGIKVLSETKVGDTICDAAKPLKEALPGFKPSKPVVFCGLFPVDSSEYQKLKDGLAKLQLNDASFSFEPESSSALGLGFRCGFLGLLHLEIVTERLEREFDVNLLTTTPGVVYKVHMNNGDMIDLHNPSSLPDPTLIKLIEEPWIKATIITPDEYLGSIIKMCQDKRGVQTNLSYSGNRAVVNYELPLNEVVFDFNDRLKSIQGDYKEVQGEYDLIFCNPPFYLNGLISDNDKINQAKHSDVAFVAELFSYVKYHLCQDGEFWCIYPFENRQEILKVAVNQDFSLSIDYSVNSKKNIKSRSVMCFKKEGSTIQESIITLRNSDGTYTEDYKTLTKEFHGKAL